MTTEHIIKEMIRLQKQYKEEEKIINPLKSSLNFGYIQQPSISLNGLQVTLVDEPLVRFYHKIAPYETFYFDASGSFITDLPLLKNDSGKPKRILLYALTMRHHQKKVPPIAIVEHISSNQNIFAIRNMLCRIREMEYQNN